MSLKHDAPSILIDSYTKLLQDSLPINVSFLTQPISDSLTCRMESLEIFYNKSSLYRYLLKLGVYPFLLFTTVSGGIGYGLYKSYTRSTKFVLNLLGVVYPIYACWKLIKQKQKDDDEDKIKSWLTYWIIFGSFEVLDHCMESDLCPFSLKKYNLYKLFILYWAQSPHSNGAQLLYRHVLQKPSSIISSLEKNTKENKNNMILFQQQNKEEEEEEEHTITITTDATTMYNHLDGGYSSLPPIQQHNNSSSSDDDDDDDDDSISHQLSSSNNHIITNTFIPSSTSTTTTTTTSTQEKETTTSFPPLSYTTPTVESAW